MHTRIIHFFLEKMHIFYTVFLCKGYTHLLESLDLPTSINHHVIK